MAALLGLGLLIGCHPSADAKQPDGGPSDGGAPTALLPHQAAGAVTGGASARSTHYRVVMATGAAPAGVSASSAERTFHGGPVGSTQGRERAP